jgi:thioredoxin 1
MFTRRFLLAATAAAVFVSPVGACTFQPYQADAVETAIKSGKPVVVHVYAPRCLQCHAQTSILSGLENDHTVSIMIDKRMSMQSSPACARP